MQNPEDNVFKIICRNTAKHFSLQALLEFKVNPLNLKNCRKNHSQKNLHKRRL